MNDEKQEQAYWLLLTLESKLSKRIISDIIANWCRQRSGTLQEFFSLTAQQWSDVCQLDENTVAKLEHASEKFADQIALIEQFAERGIHILTVLDGNYPRMLTSALSLAGMPPVLFYVGNLDILDLISVAIIGSRNAGEESLEFTRLAAQYLAEQGANVISGNARERNKLVTGLARVVIVAESNTQGGTWEGANGALRQSRPLYVRQSDFNSNFPAPGRTASLLVNFSILFRSHCRGKDACVARRGGGWASRGQDAGDASVPSPLNPSPAPTERHPFSGGFTRTLPVKGAKSGGACAAISCLFILKMLERI